MPGHPTPCHLIIASYTSLCVYCRSVCVWVQKGFRNEDIEFLVVQT